MLLSKFVSQTIFRLHRQLTAIVSLCVLTCSVGLPLSAQANGVSQQNQSQQLQNQRAQASAQAMSAAKIKQATAQLNSVNLNTATAEQLASVLKGVGTTKARAIVEYRSKVGKFRSIDELEEVKGIGPSIVARNKGRIKLSQPRR